MAFRPASSRQSGRPSKMTGSRGSRPCTPELVAELCRKAGFDLSGRQVEHLVIYLDLLMQWNRKINLVGFKNWEDTLATLVLDSFYLARFLSDLPPATEAKIPATLPCPDKNNDEKNYVNPTVWDLGAGAGLPGIPLRMVWQEGCYWLVEAREKRALFLATALSRLGLPGTHIFHGRAETFMLGKLADVIVSRAFMPWPQVLKLVRPRLVPGGLVILLTKEPVAPADVLPGDTGGAWEKTASLAYRVGQDTRYFSSLVGVPINAPS